MMCRFALAALFALTCARAAGSVPPHSDSLRQLRFSPDGRYVLAQDNSAIWALTADPLAVLFRIPAEFAGDAQFTPDSQHIIFVKSLAGADRQPAARERILLVRSAPRVERWRVADGTHIGLTEIKGLRCETEQLSPDGQTLACDDAEGTLKVIDVASGEVAFEKKKFVQLIPLYNYTPGGYVDIPNGQFLGDLAQASMDFSPDGQFLLARPTGGEGKAIAWDLRARRVVDLAGRFRKITDKFCAFVAPHRLLIPVSSFQGGHGSVMAELVAFPSPEILSKFTVPVGPLIHTADPHFILVRPFGRLSLWDPNAKRTAGVELATGGVIISETPALDMFGRRYVAEQSPWVVGLYERGKGLQATIPLHPASPTTRGRDQE